METAVVIRARLPAGLERLRRRSVAEARRGLPAHLTLLYPFVEAGQLDPAVRQAVAAVAARHATFDYRLVSGARWPGVAYVAVDPVEPFVALQADLARVFPDYPIYGEPWAFAFVPHVTVAEGAGTDEAAVLRDSAWMSLPRTTRASALDVIANDGGGWRLVWRVRLARMPP